MFKKNTVIGISVTPEIGLEAAVIDYYTKTISRYAVRQLTYDNNRKEIADMDIFKETLQDILLELQAPKGSEIFISIPTITFKIVDYPASLNEEQTQMAIEEDLATHPLFQNNEPCISATRLSNSTMQFNKIAYTAAQKTMLIEMAMQIKELGYKLIGVDTSVNSTLNALLYSGLTNTSPDASWVLVLVDNNFCRIIPMIGNSCIDSYEEKISIGEVLGDAENYSTVVNAISPIIKNLPSKCLYVVSKTNVISAETLAGQLQYNAPIVHHEANFLAKEPVLATDADLDERQAKLISLDVIGAAISRDMMPYAPVQMNLFNNSLGDIYTSQQPLEIKIGNRRIVLSVEKMLKWSIAIAILIAIATVLICMFLAAPIKQNEERVQELDKQIADIERFLKENDSISASLFDEGDEIRLGIVNNKNIYSYYTIVGTEIPKKLWLTGLELGKNITIEGQADNLESVYGFFRNIKDYNPESGIKLQKLGLATKSGISALADSSFDKNSVLTSLNADFYEFRISNAPEKKAKKGDDKQKKDNGVPDLEPLDE